MSQPPPQPGQRARRRRPLLWSIGAAVVGHTLALGALVPMITGQAPAPGPAADPLDLAQLADVLMPTAPDPDEQLLVDAVEESPEPPPPETTRIAARDSNPERETVRRP